MTEPAWTRHLPAEARTEMTAELAGLAGEQRDVALAAWRSTAEVYADPELLAVLTADHQGDGGPVPMPTPVRVRIDLNARTHDGLYVPARRSLASGPVQRGDTVTVFEPDDGIMTTATVKRLDDDWLHLDVDWGAMHDIPARELDVWRDPQLAERIRAACVETERGKGIDLGSFEQYLDDDPIPPETAAGLAYLRDRPDVFGAADDEPAEPNPRIQRAVAEIRAEQTAQAGYTIGVYLPPEATEADIDAIMTRVADAVHDYEYEGQWDPFVVGHAGDWLYVDHHPDQVMDYAGHVRARWARGEAVAKTQPAVETDP